MTLDFFVVEKIQGFAILFSLFLFFFIFNLVKKKRIREEYSLLWFLLSLFLLYLSLDRFAVDQLGNLLGIAYPPSALTLMTTGFTFLLLIHLTVVVTRHSEQNKELIQELGLLRSGTPEKNAEILVIVPAYNEEQNIAKVIDELTSVDIPLDIVVINDGSTDETSQISRSGNQVQVIDLQHNLGIGGAVQTGFKYAAQYGYDIAVQFDGDGQHLADEIPKLLDALKYSENANMVIGSRFLELQQGYRSTFIRRLGIRLFQTVNSLLIGQRVTDNTSGFRAYDRKAIKFLARYYPDDYPEPEAVILLGRNGFQITEIFTLMRCRQGGSSSIGGIRGAYYMIKVLLAILMTALRKPTISTGTKT